MVSNRLIIDGRVSSLEEIIPKVVPLLVEACIGIDCQSVKSYENEDINDALSKIMPMVQILVETSQPAEVLDKTLKTILSLNESVLQKFNLLYKTRQACSIEELLTSTLY